MMELKQKNKLTNVSVRSFVGSDRNITENSVFNCTMLVVSGSIPVKSWWKHGSIPWEDLVLANA
jgi:hypothetical protein